MISFLELRSTVPGFSTLEPRVLETFARGAIERRYTPSQVLYRAGAAADGLYVILSGKVLVVRESGGRSELLHTESAGGVLGEIPVFGGGPFPATATAVVPTRCAHLPLTIVERLLSDEPTFARFALRRIAMRAQSLLSRIDELTATTILSRVAAFLVSRAAAGPAKDFTLGVSQQALATDLGTAREVVVRSLAALVDAGAIARTGRSTFIVKRMSVLQSIARAGS
jgi:CRP/FNR family transcriptional regulator